MSNHIHVIQFDSDFDASNPNTASTIFENLMGRKCPATTFGNR